MDDRELRASLATIGAILPALEYENELIDGRKRRAMCAELGVSIDVVALSSLQEACARLYAQHPRRGLELAQRHGVKLLHDLAQHCGTTPAAIARELRDAKPKPLSGNEWRKRRRNGHAEMRELRKSPKMVQVLLFMEPELREYGRELAARKGHGNVSRIVREALWKEVALTLPQVPLHQPRRVQPPNGRRRTG